LIIAVALGVGPIEAREEIKTSSPIAIEGYERSQKGPRRDDGRRCRCSVSGLDKNRRRDALTWESNASVC
jgi:hypothetical protein